MRKDKIHYKNSINRGIDRLRATLYREDNWLSDDRLLTTLNGTANWYSDEVFSYEALGRIYGKLFSSSLFRIRLIAETVYQDATITYSSGVPYWTPNELFIKGGGIDFRYQKSAQDPTFWIESELMVKHNRDEIYLASAGQLNARIARYWELVLNAELSSSEIYRYNNVGFSLRYTFSKKLSPGN